MIYHYKWKDDGKTPKPHQQTLTAAIVYDTTANWDAQNELVQPIGKILVYTDYQVVNENGKLVYYPGVKFGDGKTKLKDLEFIGQYETDLLMMHISNAEVHITQEERDYWNNKLNVTDGMGQEVIDETLILHRH